jgi:hypothetical protein
VKGRIMPAKTQDQRDHRINELHGQARKMWPQLEKLIDELKMLGPHSLDGINALTNTRQWLKDLSQR